MHFRKYAKSRVFFYPVDGKFGRKLGPKDLPVIARTAGRLAGRAIGYVQLARGQFESVMQQSQARQVFFFFGIFLVIFLIRMCPNLIVCVEGLIVSAEIGVVFCN